MSDKGESPTSSSGYQWPKWLVWCLSIVIVALIALCIALPLSLTEDDEIHHVEVGSLAIGPFDPFTVNIWDEWGTSTAARDAFNALTEDQMVGQLQQFDWQRNQEGGLERNDYFAEILKGNVGSLLNLQEPEDNAWLQEEATRYWKTPILYSNDTIHGHSTIFPVNIGMAAAFDRELVYKGAEIGAIEGLVYGIRMTFAPNLDITYDPRWGRVSEGCGEDPYLTGQLGLQFVKGFQDHKVAACVKHVTGYGAARAGLDYAAADMDYGELLNIYLAAMKPAIMESWTFMSSYNIMDGIPAHSNRYMFNDIIRGHWGWNGFIIADYIGVEDLQTLWQAEDERDAVRRAIYGGVDMSMSDGYYLRYGKSVLDEVAPDGHTYREYFRQSAQRINAVKDKVGLFDEDGLIPPYDNAEEVICSEGHMATAKEAVRKSIVLLKNQRVPLDDEDTTAYPPPLPITAASGTPKILLVGQLADSPRDMIGSWPARAFAVNGCYPEKVITYKRAICDEEEKDQYPVAFPYDCEYMLGYSDPVFPHVFHTQEQNEQLIDDVVQEVTREGSDYTHVLFMVGDKELQNGETTSRTNLTLSGYQGDLLRKVQAAVKENPNRPNLIAVYLTARAMVMEWEAENMDAVVYGWVAGHQGGPGLKEVLFGDYDATGKMPITVPRNVGQIPLYYHQTNSSRDIHGMPWEEDGAYAGTILYRSDYIDSLACPRYVFGHGLHYNSYSYSNYQLTFESQTVTISDHLVESVPVIQIPKDTTSKIQLSINVAKTGNIAGAEIVQVYVRDVVRTVVPENKRLREFARLEFTATETSHTAEFELDVNEIFGFYTQDLEYIIEPGDFEIMISHNSHDETHKIRVTCV